MSNTAAGQGMDGPPNGLLLRPGRDADAADFIALIGGCWAEYPGCILDVDGELPELRTLASYFAAQGGMLWAAEQGGMVVGMVATRPLNHDASWEICRMYVAADQRGSGLAHRLLALAEDHARAAGAAHMVLWTDTRFLAAHRFYEKHSYVRAGSIRILDDLSKSLEFRYAKPAAGLVVEALDAAAAASAERPLSSLLITCVARGEDLAFRHPLAPEAARRVWKKVSAGVAEGSHVLLAAWLDGRLVGSVQLICATAETQQHRASIAHLMVDPAWRRRGVGRALLQRAEQAAQRLGRSLLLLESISGAAGEHLARAQGWVEVGHIPGHSRQPDGSTADAVLLWKNV